MKLGSEHSVSAFQRTALTQELWRAPMPRRLRWSSPEYRGICHSHKAHPLVHPCHPNLYKIETKGCEREFQLSKVSRLECYIKCDLKTERYMRILQSQNSIKTCASSRNMATVQISIFLSSSKKKKKGRERKNNRKHMPIVCLFEFEENLQVQIARK